MRNDGERGYPDIQRARPGKKEGEKGERDRPESRSKSAPAPPPPRITVSVGFFLRRGGGRGWAGLGWAGDEDEDGVQV
jgi:hypothetical protein